MWDLLGMRFPDSHSQRRVPLHTGVLIRHLNEVQAKALAALEPGWAWQRCAGPGGSLSTRGGGGDLLPLFLLGTVRNILGFAWLRSSQTSGFRPQSWREGWEEARGAPWGVLWETLPEHVTRDSPWGKWDIGNTFLQNALKKKKHKLQEVY